MMKRPQILLLALLALSMPLTALADEDIMQRIRRQNSESENFLEQPYANPAIKQFKHDYSLSSIATGYELRNETEAIRLQEGNRMDRFTFTADSYMKHKNSTLWGNASYDNGKTRNIRWNETADAGTVYPYVIGDATGGDMNEERYSFAGGYSSFNGRWGWGGTLSYTAGLYYRNVDPRPRNITGALKGSIGIAAVVTGDYLMGVAGTIEKYKQTNDVSFFSELGQAKLYHLTGMGNEYSRFAGTGYSTYYNGWECGAVINLYPKSHEGLTATMSLSRFSCDNILSDLNELPMADVSQNTLQAEAGYAFKTRKDRWNIKSVLYISRRTGKEHVFGDPSSQSYPQIGTLSMFRENKNGMKATAMWERQCSYGYFSILPTAGYLHWQTLYADPSSHQTVNSLALELRSKAGIAMGNRVFSTFALAAQCVKPLKSELTLENGGELASEGANEAVISDFRFLESTNWYLCAEAHAHVKITDKYALKIGADWRHGVHTAGITSDNVTTNVTLLF